MRKFLRKLLIEKQLDKMAKKYYEYKLTRTSAGGYDISRTSNIAMTAKETQLALGLLEKFISYDIQGNREITGTLPQKISARLTIK